jgi:hypothetical protein
MTAPDISPEAVAKMQIRLRLYGDDPAADLLEALAAKLAEATAERDAYALRYSQTGQALDTERARAEAAEADRDRLAKELDEARAFLGEFAAAKIDALPSPHYRSPEDAPDPVVDAATVWAWQTDARALARSAASLEVDKIVALVGAARTLASWCVESIPPDETMDKHLHALDAALTALSERGEG